MTKQQIRRKVDGVTGINGMIVNERLYAAGLDREFDKALKKDKAKAEFILELLQIDRPSIEMIVKNAPVRNKQAF